MRTLAVRARTTEVITGDQGPLPPGLSAAAACAVRDAHRFGRDLHVTRAAQQAVAALCASMPGQVASDRLGVILASDRGDQHVLARRLPEFAQRVGGPEVAPADLFRAIAYFPVGRVLKSVTEKLGGCGAVAVMPANLAQAHEVADIWLTAGRADLVAVVSAEASADGTRAEADARLWQADRHPSRPPDPAVPGLAVTAWAERAQYRAAGSCVALARAAIESVARPVPPRTALIVGSMLANDGESLVTPGAPGEPAPFEPSIRSLGHRLGFGPTFVLVGSSGAAMTGLALAQDLVALGRADRVVVCGVDLVGGAMAQALGLLHCHDLPHMQGGAVAVLLEPAAGPALGDVPVLQACQLVSPVIPARPGMPLAAPWLPDSRPAARQVMLSGISSADLGYAAQLAGKLWPGAVIANRDAPRDVGADVLRLASSASDWARPMAIVAVHSLGGTGWCLMS